MYFRSTYYFYPRISYVLGISKRKQKWITRLKEGIAKDSVDKSMKFVQLVVISTTGLYLKIKKIQTERLVGSNILSRSEVPNASLK